MIIGFVGVKGSGKDTCAEVLVNEYGFTRRAFADKLKEIVADVYDFDLELFHDPKMKEVGFNSLGGNTLRYALQVIGTEGFRAVNRDTWIKYLMKRSRGTDTVVSDCRFPNEAEAIIKEGILIGVVRKGFGAPRVKLANPISWIDWLVWKTFKQEHSSESQVYQAIKMARYIIYNDGSVKDLQDQVRKIMDDLIYRGFVTISKEFNHDTRTP